MGEHAKACCQAVGRAVNTRDERTMFATENELSPIVM